MTFRSIAYLFFAAAWVPAAALAGSTDQPNVLFVVVDDLRPELGAYGVERVRSPHIDRLADAGVVFTAAYCNAPQCGPSRASVMTGLRPRKNRFFTRNGLQPSGLVDQEAPGIPTLPALFKKAGYTTASIGKVYHRFSDDRDGWTVAPWRVGDGPGWHRITENFHTPEGIATLVEKGPGQKPRSIPWEAADVPDEAYPDGRIANRAIDQLQTFRDSGEAFFLAVGFLRPHLPLNAPKRYWDLYPEEDIKLSEQMEMPENAPPEAAYNWPELRAYIGIPKKGPLSATEARTLIRAYLACVSYVDAQVGRVLDELDRLQLAEDTIVVLWGDHGWNLGEHGLWCKHTTFETSMRAPLIFRGPGINNGRCESLTELVDIYPTLLESAGIAVPGHSEGTSLVSHLKDPSRSGREAAIGYWKQADTIKTGDFRLTVWPARKGKEQATMLFDHRSDPEETINVADHPDYAPVVETLTSSIRSLTEDQVPQ